MNLQSINDKIKPVFREYRFAHMDYSWLERRTILFFRRQDMKWKLILACQSVKL